MPHDNVQAVLEFVIEAMVDAVLGVDPEGRVTLSNSGAANLTGYTRDELAGKPISDLLVDDNSGLRTVVRRRIEDGDILRREESWLVTKSGKKIPVSVTGAPVLDATGMLKGSVLVARDVRQLRQLLVEKEAEIHRRREAEEALRTAKVSLEEKLEETRRQLLLAARHARHARRRRRPRAAQHRADPGRGDRRGARRARGAREHRGADAPGAAGSRTGRRAHHRARPSPDAARAARSGSRRADRARCGRSRCRGDVEACRQARPRRLRARAR